MPFQRTITRSPKISSASKPLPERRSTRARRETAKAREVRILRETAAKATKSRMFSRHDPPSRMRQAPIAPVSQASSELSRRAVAQSPLQLVDGDMRAVSVSVKGDFDVTRMRGLEEKTCAMPAHRRITGIAQVDISAVHQEAGGALIKTTEVKDGGSTSSLQYLPEGSITSSPAVSHRNHNGCDRSPQSASGRPIPLPMSFWTEEEGLKALWKEAFGA